MYIMTDFRVSKKAAVSVIICEFLFIAALNVLIIVKFPPEMFPKLCLLTTALPAFFTMAVLTKDGFGKSWFLFWLSTNTLCFMRMIIGVLYYCFKINIVADIIVRTIVFTLILLSAVFMFRRKFRRIAESTDDNWLSVCFIPMLITLIYFLEHNIGMPETENKKSLIVGTLLVFLMIGVYGTIYKAFITSYTSMKKEQETRALKSQIELQKRRFEDLSKSTQNDKIFRHDLRHRNMLAKTYLESKQYDKLEELLDKELETVFSSAVTEYTASELINAVLTEYDERAKNKGLKINISVDLPKELRIDENEFCIMLSNLLENAVDSAKSHVALCIKQINSQLSVNVRNDYDGIVSKNADGTYITTKENGSGIGLQSVRAVLEKSGGFIEITDDNNEFCVYASMKN